MDNIKIIEINSKTQWEEIADNSVEIYDKWQYVSAFYKNGDGTPYMAYLQCKDGVIYNVYIKRKIKDDIKFKHLDISDDLFDIVTPYGYGGVKIKGNVTEKEKILFFEKFNKYCVDNNIVSEFIRLNPLEDNYKNYCDKDYDINNISKTIYIKLDNKDQVWSDLNSTCRNRIRKAINNNLIVKNGFNEKMLNEFKNIYDETMKRDNADDYYFFKDEFFEDIKNNLSNHSTIYTAYLNDKPIDTILVIYSGENAHYHLGGTLSDYMKLGAHNLTIYTAAIDMLEKGYKKFHLGGGYGGDQSPLFTFKKKFNKNGELDFYIGKKIYCKEIYENLCKIRNVNSDSKYFPLYRS